MSRLHHVGIAVRDLARALDTWRTLLGAEAAGPSVEVPEEGVRIAFLRAGSVKVELLEPLSADGPIAKFLEKRGEGIHHLAFAVPDIRAAMARLRAAGVPLLDEEPRFRGGNRWVAFCHPRGANGVLTELVQYVSPEAEEAGT
jgi:methylmalonyl-CoA/ethylmalonyl-CoA epimerase